MSYATRTSTEGAPKSSQPEQTEASPGSLEATYHIEKVVASGGMGVVLAARHKHLGTRVAIKLLHDTNTALRQRFLREAQLAASLDSPFIVRVRDYGLADDGQPFLVMDLLEGGTLRTRIRREPIPFDEVRRLAVEIVRAIGHVHDIDVVHRDIKPTNVFLTKGSDGLEHVKLLDFGIAKRTRGEGARDADELTGTNELLGTTAYMAPEQLVEARVVDHRADLFSIGAVMYEMLTRERALNEDGHARRLSVVMGGPDLPIRPLSEIAPAVPAALARTVMRCLETRPERRFASAKELLDALLDEREAPEPAPEPATTRSTQTPVPLAPDPVRRSKASVLIGAVAVLVTSSGAAAWLLTRGPSPPRIDPTPQAVSSVSEQAVAPLTVEPVAVLPTSAPSASTPAPGRASAEASSPHTGQSSARGRAVRPPTGGTAGSSPGGPRWNDRH